MNYVASRFYKTDSGETENYDVEKLEKYQKRPPLRAEWRAAGGRGGFQSYVT